MKFDWYSASVPADPQVVLGALDGFDDLASFERTRPLHGYQEAWAMRRGPTDLFTVMWGGSHTGGTVFVQGSGLHAPPLADRLRRNPALAHKVVRADIAQDYDDSTAWSKLVAICLDIADRRGLRIYQAGDWHRGEAGRTLYVGSPQSVVQLRLYEKGKKEGFRPDWVRLELCVRPKKREARELLSTALPSDFFGCSSWSVELAERIGVPELERIHAGTVYRQTDDARARAALLAQYGKTLARWADDLGSWSKLGPTIKEELQSAKQKRQ